MLVCSWAGTDQFSALSAALDCSSYSPVRARREMAPSERDQRPSIREAISAPDAQTVTVQWKQPYIQADALFSAPFLPRHLLERAYNDDKAALGQASYWTEEFVGTSIGTTRQSRGLIGRRCWATSSTTRRISLRSWVCSST